MNGISRPHPAHVPTLTEIIEEQAQVSAAPAVGTRPSLSPVPSVPVIAVPPSVPLAPPVPLDALPVLGEVVSQQAAQQVLPLTQQASQATQPQNVPPAVTEAQLAHRVLSDVQRQIDSMLEFRLREAMAPVLARHSEAIVRELKDELARTMRDVVARSVAQEVAKLRPR